jgi:hypothetical protein
LLIVIALLPAGTSAGVVAGLAAALGAFTPPVAACLRAALPDVVADPGQLRSVISLQATLSEFAWIAGPPLTLGVAAVVSTRAALLVAAGGLLLGTAAYMSPEQARGKAVDKRADVWAFGCVLYEMLTGQMAFPGNTVSDHIAAILEREPDWARLPATLPPALRTYLTRCLQKDPRQRVQAIGGETRLIERFAIGYSPSASALATLRGRFKGDAPPVRALLAFGDAVYTAPGAMRRSALDLSRERGFDFTQLPNTRLEVTAIRSLFPAGGSRVYLGAEYKGPHGEALTPITAREDAAEASARGFARASDDVTPASAVSRTSLKSSTGLLASPRRVIQPATRGEPSLAEIA